MNSTFTALSSRRKDCFVASDCKKTILCFKGIVRFRAVVFSLPLLLAVRDILRVEEPLELVNPPFAIVRDIPIPVYGEDEYRAVSLRQILSKMGPSERSHNGGLMKTLGDYYDVTIESKIGKM